jgi:hypothetical protein
MAKAAVSLLAAVAQATRRFESFPSPPNSLQSLRAHLKLTHE